MYDARKLRRSFAAGEITPEMHGRVDHVKFQTGLALAKNFITLPYGPAINRPGTRFIAEAKYADRHVRLIPFALTDGSGYLLEVGHLYIRFYYQGGRVLDTSTSIEPTSVDWAGGGHTFTAPNHGLTNGTEVRLSGVRVDGVDMVTGSPMFVSDATTNTFRLRYNSPDGFYFHYKAQPWEAITVERVTVYSNDPYEVSTPYTSDDLPFLRFAQSEGVMTFTHPRHPPMELRIIEPSNWTLTAVSFASPIEPPDSVTVQVGRADEVDPQKSLNHGYVVTAVDRAGQESPPSSLGHVANDLFRAGNCNVISWVGREGAEIYHIYKSIAWGPAPWSVWAGRTFGYIGTAEGTHWVDDNFAPDYSRTPPSNQTDIFDGANEYPRVAAYFEQRRVFASSINAPQNVWMTRSGSDSNMARNVPPQEDSPIEFRIAADTAFAVQHMVSLDELLLITDSSVWRVFARDAGALTPFNVTARRAASIGATTQAHPVVVNATVLFAEPRSGHIAELNYNTSVDRVGYEIDDASIFAAHLFDGYRIVSLAYAEHPHKIVWAVRHDGVLLGMTFVPGQEVRAWHQHHTLKGEFREVCVVTEGHGADAVYVVVNRDVADRGRRRFIERLDLSHVDSLEDSFYVDSGLSYSGPSRTEFTGLDHLGSETVAILADGIVVPPQQVVDGKITLDFPASTVHVGLPIVADLQTLPMDLEVSAEGWGSLVNVNKVHLQVYRTSHIKAGPSFDRLREFAQRTDEPMGTPPRLFTGIASVTIDPEWDLEGRVCVRQDLPLPITIASITAEVAVGS